MKNGDGTDPISQRDAGTRAGMSERQIKTASSIAKIPEEEFEAAVKSQHPPPAYDQGSAGHGGGDDVSRGGEGWSRQEKGVECIDRFELPKSLKNSELNYSTRTEKPFLE